MFVLFWGSVYYPLGGWADNHSVHSTLEEALGAIPAEDEYSWWHIADVPGNEIVRESR